MLRLLCVDGVVVDAEWRELEPPAQPSFELRARLAMSVALAHMTNHLRRRGVVLSEPTPAPGPARRRFDVVSIRAAGLDGRDVACRLQRPAPTVRGRARAAQRLALERLFDR